MAEIYNKTIIIGRLGNNPKYEHSEKGDIACFCVSNNTFRDGAEIINWHDIKAVGKQAKLCAEYLHEGDLCCIEGTLDTKVCKKDGEMRYSQVVVAEHVTFLTPKRAQA